MLSVNFTTPVTEQRALSSGTVLLRRGQATTAVIYIESGRVALGLLNNQTLEHRLGSVQGPAWLDASSVVLELRSAVDAVAESDVVVRRIPMARFRQILSDSSHEVQTVLHDVALAHRKQTELAVSRLAKDAEARFAEWLLQHAERGKEGALAISLQQRKRLIAAQLGIAPETLSRVLRQLKERSLIKGTGRQLQVVDPVGLRHVAGK